MRRSSIKVNARYPQPWVKIQLPNDAPRGVSCYLAQKYALESTRKGRWCLEAHGSVLTLLALGRLAGRLGYPEHDEPSLYSGAAPAGRYPGSAQRASIVVPKSFADAQGLADCFKRQQLVILNLREVDGKLSKRMVDFCAGLTYALGGRMCPIAHRLFLLAPRGVEVLDEEGERLAERAFFNQL